MLCLNPKRLKDTILNQFVKMPHYRPFHSFFNFMDYMDKFGKIHQHQWKERLKISKLAKFESDTS